MGFSIGVETLATFPIKEGLKYFCLIYRENYQWEDQIPQLRDKFLKLSGGDLINLFDYEPLFDYRDDMIVLEDWNSQEFEDSFDHRTDLNYDDYNYDDFEDQLGYFILEGLSNHDDIDPYLIAFEETEYLSINMNMVELTLNYTSSYKCSDDLDIDYQHIADQISQLKRDIPNVKISTQVSWD